MGHEFDIAKQMAAGDVASPSRYENVWLFDIRITGTGIAYRSAHDEYAMRPPDIFLSPDFIERCNGLPVIFEHPIADPKKGKTSLLDHTEFAERSIGTVIYPYRKGDEVWGISKIYDDDAAKLMTTTHLSTSPGINFGKPGTLKNLLLSTGDTLVIEGDPSMIDHIAICENGVWDKGMAPSGINLGALDMPEDKMKTEDKMDSEMPAWAKTMADSFNARMDALEKKDAKADAEDDKDDEKKSKADAEAEDEDFKKKDAKDDTMEEEERAVKKAEADKAKADASRKDMETAYADSVKKFSAEIAALKAQIPRDLSDDDRNAIAAAKSRADSAYGAIGKNAPHEMLGETPLAFRRRLAAGLQNVSKDWTGIALRELPDAAFNNAENAIYADAAAYSRSPMDVPANELREIKTTTPHGHRVSTYVGSPRAWMDMFGPAVRMRARITPGTEGKR